MQLTGARMIVKCIKKVAAQVCVIIVIRLLSR